LLVFDNPQDKGSGVCFIALFSQKNRFRNKN